MMILLNQGQLAKCKEAFMLPSMAFSLVHLGNVLFHIREERKEFIRAKYINHQYAQKLEESPSALSKVCANFNNLTV
jgi:ABC-type dipeptide/oligopeptide/nickel transport system permease component